jgi:hypothetical protein
MPRFLPRAAISRAVSGAMANRVTLATPALLARDP